MFVERILIVTVMVTAFFMHEPEPVNSQTPVDSQSHDDQTSQSPRAVVTHWLGFHRTGERKKASALTTGSHFHRAQYLLSSKRDGGVRVERALGNDHAAAVVTNVLDDDKDADQVILFWLVRREGAWRINKSDQLAVEVADERLRGFLEAGDVRWDIQRHHLLGRWESGPGHAPAFSGIACGSRFQLDDDQRFKLYAWGPALPADDFDDEATKQGEWKLDGDRILFEHESQKHESQVVWQSGKTLVLESTGGQATYEQVPVQTSSTGNGHEK